MIYFEVESVMEIITGRVGAFRRETGHCLFNVDQPQGTPAVVANEECMAGSKMESIRSQ
jgi:hypothetical protein